MYEFEYHQPKSTDEAAGLLAKLENSKPLAGGMSLLPSMKLRLTQHSHIVDLAAVENIRGIRRDGDVVEIGAMTCHYDVSVSSIVRQAIPALASLAGGIGDPLVRNRGTIGGSIANADPAADYPSSVLALNATVITSRREIAGDDFFTGLFETALAPNEIIKAVRFPIPLSAAYVKFPNPASRFALVGVFVAKTSQGVRVAVTGAGPYAFHLKQAEEALNRQFSCRALEGFGVSPENLNDDFHATAEYRAHVVGVILRRAVDEAAQAAEGK